MTNGILKLFQNKKPFKMVKDWMKIAGQPCPSEELADTGYNAQADLYANLIEEEYEEFKQALKDKDEVEQLDAVCDLIWVAAGYAHSKGWDLDDAFAEVGRSNYSKFPTKKDPNTGKVLKSKNFSPPDLVKYIDFF
jgi:predicted HAD superfamily Cof-like phosphohydrolase